ncbi:MAG: ATP synthase F1 subunit gamma [Clostridia bacterium]|nr:ATP synthase F1 subunit gamma [Clostridia bacterium]
MANAREIKNRIKSIKETRQITKAMKLISAAKLKKARQQLEQTAPFFEKIKATIADILVHSGDIKNPFFDIKGKSNGCKKCFFIITGDKGMAGGYNHNIIKLVENKLANAPDAVLLIAGIVGKNHFMRAGYNVDQDFDYSVQNPTVYRAREIAERIIEMFSSGEVGEVNLVYTKMESSIKQEPRVMKLLPLDLEALKKELKVPKEVPDEVDEALIYEPSPQAVFNVLIPKYVKGVVYGALVEAFTSEQSARMSAMDNATSNADEMLSKLNLHYNRVRQTAITQEISEIVGGASALK